MTEQEQRLEVARIARSWILTPYHHMARIKGEKGGVDCSQILIGVYSEAGVIEPFDPGYYPPDWFLHKDGEKVLEPVLARAHETDTPGIGDLVLWQFGRAYSHAAIVVDPGWPTIVHAVRSVGCVIEDRGDGGGLDNRKHRFFTVWGG
jgi:cell wall-associated NlpC family hydrolase